ncbi:MAG: efflux RND transporter permease subunit [Planctomycetota bacterium]|jgi:predicted RND superfamily exporter protein
MSADGPDGPLDALGRLGVAHPRRVLGSAAVLLAVCGALAATMTVNTSRHTMVDADNPHQAKQVAYFERFGLPNTMVFVVDGAEVAARQVFVDDLAARLEAHPAFAGRVLARITPDTVAEVLLLQTRFEPPDGVDARGYLSAPDGARHYLLVFPEIPGTQQAHEVRPAVEAARAARDAAIAARPGGAAAIRADLTGPAVLVVDEEVEIQRGMLTTSGATALGILLLLYLAFRSLRYTLLAIVPVILGVAGTMAVAATVYGELNMVTSSCSSILLALGIDFGVFLLSRYGELVRSGAPAEAAIRGAIRKAGRALFVGAITTAVAFLTTTTTEFTAYARLGVIVALGLLIMMAATLTLMPALLWVAGRGEGIEAPELPGVARLPPVLRAGRWGIVAVGLGGVVAGLLAAQELTFNTRFYDFIPARGEGARALLAIEDDPQVTPLRAMIPVDGVEPARALAERLRGLPEVSAVQTGTDLLPPFEPAALEARFAAPTPEGLTDVMQRAWRGARTVAERGHYLPTDLPPTLGARFVSRDGRALGIHVIPEGNIWEPDVARAFHESVAAVAPNATGMAMHIHAHLTFIKEGFARAAAGAAALVFLVLLAAFRRASDAVLALVPAAVGFAWMLGVMALLGFRFDAANIVVLPLILGIGVDAGVHLVHRTRQSAAEHGMARLDEVVSGTGSAVALASITTAMGFAALMLAEYGAMFSLGLLMTIGILCCLVASLLVLPSIMVVTGRAR